MQTRNYKPNRKILAVAFPSWQCRARTSHRIANRTAKNGYRHIWLQANTRSGQRLGICSEILALERNTEIGQRATWQAQTPNGQFCVIAALPSLENFITFARW